MPDLYDISEWSILEWYNTGGTRSKQFVQGPDGKYYYFKRSYKTDGREYFYEFWSEIVASEVGLWLGFNMLQYDLAVLKNEMGCICESMHIMGEEELNEGGKYLQALDTTFKPEEKMTRSKYSFQLIEEALDVFKLGKYKSNLIEILVFDAIIGNSDRHQENWAFITRHGVINKVIQNAEKKTGESLFENIPAWFRIFMGFKKLDDGNLKQAGNLAKLYFQNVKSFAPIYDSGSSLGRELEDGKVTNMLKNLDELQAYLRRGTSEIHWNNEKLNHFDLLKKLLNSAYKEIVKDCLNRIIQMFSSEQLQKIIVDIDKKVPENMDKYRLPVNRKQLMIKIITLRIDKLRELIS